MIGLSFRTAPFALRSGVGLILRAALVLDLAFARIHMLALARRVRLAHLLLTLLDHDGLPADGVAAVFTALRYVDARARSMPPTDRGGRQCVHSAHRVRRRGSGS